LIEIVLDYQTGKSTMAVSHKENESTKLNVSSNWDHTTHEQFYDYYANASLTAETRERFRAIRNAIVRADPSKDGRRPCQVADIGCGAGTQSLVWAELGHNVHGVDINERLLELARQRAAEANHEIEFLLGSAVSVPLPDSSMDVCLAVELLEHVADWKSCMSEFTRLLRPGGVLFLSTTNKLCPIQHEFNLPLYSWYPAFLKRRFEQLSVTTRPRLANYAKYPAVNWFTYYSLRNLLARSGFVCMDRFDVIDTSKLGVLGKAIVSSIRRLPVLRWFAHMATEGTTVIALKRNT
jgi:2-polyprenyl-6-hydroxyphenyl methylase/3-demethylubiquinone-9 3-methyltransferase